METNQKEGSKSKNRWNCKEFPKRYFLTSLGFVGIALAYSVRLNFSLVILAMTKRIDRNSTAACIPDDVETYGGESYLDGPFSWNLQQQGALLAAFFYGYLVTPLVSGVVVTRWGGKWVFGTCVLVTGALSFATDAVAYIGYGALFALRIVQGLAAGFTFPAMHSLIAVWVPMNERSRQCAFIYVGTSVGEISTVIISGIIISNMRWRVVFYMTGVLCCLWFALWWWLVYPTPQQHPGIRTEEIEEIMRGTGQRARIGKVPWISIATSVPMIALTLTHLLNEWGYYTLMTSFPTYLDSVFRISIVENGVYCALPFLMLLAVSSVSAYVADYLRAKTELNITTLRKIMNSFAMFVPGVCFALVGTIGCFLSPIIFLSSMAYGFNGFKYSGFFVTHIDMSPEFAGFLAGITHGFATLPGILAPYYSGFITRRYSDKLIGWQIVFLTASVFYFAGGLLFACFCSAEEQPWGRSLVAKRQRRHAALQRALSRRQELEAK